MRQRRNQLGYSVGDFFGALGNSWQGGEDAPMYGANAQSDPYATTTGAYAAGEATSQAAGTVYHAVVDPAANFLSGALRGVGLLIGAGIILATLINARDQ